MKKISFSTFSRAVARVHNESMKKWGNALTRASLENNAGILEVGDNYVIVPTDYYEKMALHNEKYLKDRMLI